MDWEFFDRPASAVESNLSAMNGRADAALGAASSAISALSGLSMDPEPGAPKMDLPPIKIPPVVVPKSPAGDNFGGITTPRVFELDAISGLISLNPADFNLDDIGDFEPKSGFPNMPPRPDGIDTSGAPTPPTLGDIAIPLAPDLVLPDLPDLVDLTIPEFAGIELPAFSDLQPDFEGSQPSSTLVWSEPTYSSELLSDVTAKVRSMLLGGTGLPTAIQQALFDAARSREAQTAREAAQTAFDAFAARNFDMPPGMLAEQINVSIEQSRLAQNTLERDILSKAAQWEIDNLRFAVEKGLAVESVLVNVFMNAAQRSFEAAKFRVEGEVNIFNAMVALFNAKQQAYRVAADVFKTKVDAELAKLEIFKAEIQAEVAKGQVNEQKVRAYEARVKAIGSVIEIYRGKMEGAKAQADVVRTRVETYKADIEGWAARIDADKKRFDAYEVAVRGETAKAQSMEAEARAYAATVQAQEAKANLKVKYVDAQIAGLRASIDKFTAQVAQERELVQASLNAVQARTQAFTADVGRYTAEIQGSNSSREIELRVTEDRLRNLLAFYDTQVREYDARMTRMLEQVKIIQDSLKASAQYTSALAQGAMSAIHVQASMSGSGSAASNNNYNVNINRKGADTA